MYICIYVSSLKVEANSRRTEVRKFARKGWIAFSLMILYLLFLNERFMYH